MTPGTTWGVVAIDLESLQGHVVVFGFRGVARRIVKQLARTGNHIVVIQSDATPPERERMRRYGVQYVEGFGQSQTVLQSINVAGALAAVVATDDDLVNIDIAMLVREKSKDVRIVVQMANAAVGRALQPAIEPGTVLEVASLASPAFVEAAVERTTHEIELGGETFVVASFPSPARGTLRSIWGDLAPIAVRPVDGSATVSCPSRDSDVAPADLVTLIGTESAYRSAGLVPEVQRAARIGRTFRGRVREALAAGSDAVDRPFRIAFGVLSILAIFSVVVLTLGYHDAQGRDMSVLDAVYFTSETIATVGFGDYYFRDQSPWLRIWAILLILLGATLVALATALLTNALVSRRLAQSLGRQRLTGMQDHIVVIGLGAVGSKVAMDLHEGGYDVAIIDSGEGQRFIPQMRAFGMPVLIGDATLRETQVDAGVDRAAGIIITTSDDLINIETGLAVRDRSDCPAALRSRPGSNGWCSDERRHPAVDRRVVRAVVRRGGAGPGCGGDVLCGIDALHGGPHHGRCRRCPRRRCHPGGGRPDARRRDQAGERGVRAPRVARGPVPRGGRGLHHRPVRGPR
jgi:Trk K+ transport system NAD-binding subunit